MIQRKTQTAQYWQTFAPTPEDLDFLHTTLLDAGRPLTSRELAIALITERCRREESELRAELSRGVFYQPKNHYALHDKVIFPALDFRLGEVVGVRAGENPEYGAFEVITVDFGPDRRQRNFAAGLQAAHRLNADVPDQLAGADLASPERLLSDVAADVPAILSRALAAQPGFAGFEDRWLMKDLLAEIHIGHLNLAEAAIEMHGGAVETLALVRDLDLPSDIPDETLAFSLNSALAADGRFDQVGVGDERRWYLCRLEPPEALSMPEPLRFEPVDFDGAAPSVGLLQLAFDLDDEWSAGLADEVTARAAAPTATLLLIYPHLIAGTLPLNRRARPFFPKGHGTRTMVTLIDGRWGNRFPAWVNHDGRYIAGLRPWFEKHKLTAGTYIVLERRDDSGEIVVDFRPKRMRREWTRWAQATDGRLDIQLRKQEIACEYDEQVIIGGDEKTKDLQELRDSAHYRQMSLRDLAFEVFTDLAGLSQQGSVHARTIYSALNVLRRLPPEPIFAALAQDERLEQSGDGAFRLSA
ncbi:MAG: hypothetical protein BWY52_00580 [Chloroflexi bacterium ADurb.Bin325]|nr:MAG: hypothetical protein BWY52_00580 [Chloroflexi bacterium ADurb.Bin325]